jgi:hypothetical protein
MLKTKYIRPIYPPAVNRDVHPTRVREPDGRVGGDETKIESFKYFRKGKDTTQS